MLSTYGAEFRLVEDREHEGEPALVVIATRTYDTTVEDLWDALTDAERIPRWFLPIEGDLKVGGRYQLEGNASGSITRCDPPEAFDITWEFGGGMSWVSVRLAPDGDRAKLTLEHTALRDDIGAEHLAKYGPGAVGIGWDLAFYGMELYVAGGGAPVDRDAVQAWMGSDEGKAFMRASGEAWGEAHAASGEDRAEARAKAERTIAFYTGG